MYLSDYLVVVRGGGGLGTAIAHRLLRSGFTVLVTELAQPLALHRAVSFAEAVYSGQATVEGVTARLADDAMLGLAFSVVGEVPVLVDLADDVLARMQPAIVVDARQAQRNLGTRREDAKLVIGLGPGFTADLDCHALVDTRRGPHLGRVYWDAGSFIAGGSYIAGGALIAAGAQPPASQPRAAREAAHEHVLRAPADGLFQSERAIGDRVLAGEALASVDDHPLVAPFAGVVRGLLHDNVPVTAGMKVADLDPRGRSEACFSISSRARSIAGGVLEATLSGMPLWRSQADSDRSITDE